MKNKVWNRDHKNMEQPLRVVQVLGRLDRGGAEAMVMNLYRRIDRSRIQFDFILHTEEECAYSEEVRSLGGRIFAVPAFKGSNAVYYRAAWRTLLAAHPEWCILHSHVRSTASLYLPIARRFGIRTIVHSHNTASGRGVSAAVKTALQYPLRYQADALFSCSMAAGKWLYGAKACESGRFYLLKNAIDTKRFAFEVSVRKRNRAALGISEQTSVIGHVGRFEAQKNHAFLLEILAALPRELDVVLLLIGEGALEEQCRQQVKKLGLEKKVRFLGSRPDVDELLCVMDLFLFPSLFEGLPVTLIEAQANGLCVLASDTITKEVEVTKLVHFQPLQTSAAAKNAAAEKTAASVKTDAEVWADKAEQLLFRTEGAGRRKQDSEAAVEAIRAAGYDTGSTADWLQNFYEGFAEGSLPDDR